VKETEMNWEADIRALEDEARRAFLGADLAALDRLWDDALHVSSPLLRVNDKPQLLELLKLGRIRHTSFVAEIEHVSRHGDVAVVMGNDVVTDPPDGMVSRRRYTNIWQLRDGAWRMIARHAQIVSREPAS
jgi:ketosteroid isomerase-like protein